MTDTSMTFLDHVDEDRAWAATRMGLDLLAEEGPVALLDELLVPVQHESGRRWQAGEYTVADEHLVTAMVDELLGATSADLGRSDPSGPRVTLVCAEGEWHASAARMMTLRLRVAGWDVRYLGASAPPAELEEHLRRRPPEALLVSCTMAAALVGAAAMVEVAHRVGVPVLAGGAAFAVSDTVAAAVGADGIAATSDEATELVDAWRGGGFRPAPATGDDDPSGERATLRAARSRMVRAVVDRSGAVFRPEDETELEGVLATLDAALLARDVDVLAHHMAWLRERELVGQVLPLPLADAMGVLARNLPEGLRTSRSYLSAATARLRTA